MNNSIKQTEFIIIIFLILLFIDSCNTKNCDCNSSEPGKNYQVTVSYIKVWDMGTGTECCGWSIGVFLDSTNTMINYKPINIPQEMINYPLPIYEGTIEVLPEIYTCYNCGPDPNPNNPAPPITMHFANILSYQRKQ